MMHGTLSGYIHDRCRCEPCTDANRIQGKKRRDQKRRYAIYGRITKIPPEEREARRSCLICRTPLKGHPLVACWRTI